MLILQIRKSVSAEVNYGIRFTETAELDTFLKQLCSEVHNRLIEIDAKGRTITLKYMVRAADAPVETAKFMGHGFCDIVTKSTTLTASTNELAVIMQTIFSIKNTLNVPANELRGIGIQISKLDTPSTAINETKTNTLKNMFQKLIEKNQLNAAHCSTNVQTNYLVTKMTSLRKTKSFEMPNGNRRIGELFAVMSSKTKVENYLNDLDLNVLAELPDDIREEVLRDQNLLLKNTNNEFGKTKTNRKPAARKIETDFQSIDDMPESSTVSAINYLGMLDAKTISTDNILDQQNWRTLLTGWLESTPEPIECDTDIIAGYFREFLAQHHLNKVHLCLRFLHR